MNFGCRFGRGLSWSRVAMMNHRKREIAPRTMKPGDGPRAMLMRKENTLESRRGYREKTNIHSKECEEQRSGFDVQNEQISMEWWFEVWHASLYLVVICKSYGSPTPMHHARGPIF